MRKCTYFWVVVVILAFQVGTLTGAQADVAGRLTLVQGRVDILRGGQLPATPAKVGVGVETGDVIRTKSLSKAQITFIDNSIMTISPQCRVAVEEYMFDPAKQKRNAVIQLFQGLAHIVVNKVFKMAEPDFIVKTNTAIVGIRGTDFGIRIQPNSSTILNRKGRLQVGNIFPEISQLSQRAIKVAYAFGPEGPRWVILGEWEGTTVFSGLPPTKKFKFHRVDWELFQNQLNTGMEFTRRHGPGYGESGGGGPSDTVAGDITITGGQGTETGAGVGGLYSGFLQTFYRPADTYQNIRPPKYESTQISGGGGTKETPEEPEKPPCHHKCHRYCHHYCHWHFPFNRPCFCDRDHYGPFWFPCNWNSCRPGGQYDGFGFGSNCWNFCSYRGQNEGSGFGSCWNSCNHRGQYGGFGFGSNCWNFCSYRGQNEGSGFGSFWNSCNSRGQNSGFGLGSNCWNFCSYRGQNEGSGFGSCWNSCNYRGQNSGFGLGSNWNSCSYGGQNQSGNNGNGYGSQNQYAGGNGNGYGSQNQSGNNGNSYGSQNQYAGGNGNGYGSQNQSGNNGNSYGSQNQSGNNGNGYGSQNQYAGGIGNGYVPWANWQDPREGCGMTGNYPHSPIWSNFITNRCFSFYRHCFCDRDHDGRCGSPFNWNFCRPGENYSRFEHCWATNPISHHFENPPGWLMGNKTGWNGGSTPPGLSISHHNLRNFPGIGPMAGHCHARPQEFRHNLGRFTPPMPGHCVGQGPGPTIANFIRNCPITNPSMLLSWNFPGNACHLPRGVPGQHCGPKVVRHLKPRPAVHQNHGPCGQGPGGPHGPNLPGNLQHPACGQGPGSLHGPNLLGNRHQLPGGQVNCGPLGPNSPGHPGQHPG
jgi:hypothetical protein